MMSEGGCDCWDLVVGDHDNGGTGRGDGAACASVGESVGVGVKCVIGVVGVESCKVTVHFCWSWNLQSSFCVGREHAVKLDVWVVMRDAEFVGGGELHDFGPECDLGMGSCGGVVEDARNIDNFSTLEKDRPDFMEW